jgi:hypothetical protein
MKSSVVPISDGLTKLKKPTSRRRKRKVGSKKRVGKRVGKKQKPRKSGKKRKRATRKK